MKFLYTKSKDPKYYKFRMTLRLTLLIYHIGILCMMNLAIILIKREGGVFPKISKR